MIIQIKGIQCDAPGCDYAINEGEWGDTPEEIKASSEAYLNKPCPKCGAPLLTQADYDALMGMLTIAPIATSLEELMYDGKPVPKEHLIGAELGMDGAGNIVFR